MEINLPPETEKECKAVRGCATTIFLVVFGAVIWDWHGVGMAICVIALYWIIQTYRTGR